MSRRGITRGLPQAHTAPTTADSTITFLPEATVQAAAEVAGAGTFGFTPAAAIGAFAEIAGDSPVGFTPAATVNGLLDPNALSSLRLWYDPAEGITMDGSNRVSAWVPKVTIGMNKSANEVTAGQDPLFVAAYAGMNNQPVLTFDKTRQDQLFNPGNWGTELTNPHTWLMVGRIASYDTAGSCPVSILTNCFIYADATNQRWGSGAEKVAKARIAAGTPFVQVGVFDNAGDGRFYENARTAVASGRNTGANTLARIRFGNFFTPDGAYDFDGQLGDFLVFEGAVSDADVTGLLLYFGSKYGITIGA